nr:hypothetical protein [Tanacetum cinerariifolium]
EAGPVGDQELQRAGDAGGVAGNQGAVRAVAVERHQGTVEPGLFMGASAAFDIVGLQHGA